MSMKTKAVVSVGQNDRSLVFILRGSHVSQRLALGGGRSATLPTMLYRFLEGDLDIGGRKRIEALNILEE